MNLPVNGSAGVRGFVELGVELGRGPSPTPSRRAPRLDDHGQQVADGVGALERVTQGHIRVQHVLVAATHPTPVEVAGCLQVPDDALGSPLSDADRLGDGSQTGPGISSDAHQHMSVVAEERPSGPLLP